MKVQIFEELYHVGTLNKQDKGAWCNSYEGEGLSVSMHPDEWTAIARLPGRTYAVHKPGHDIELTDVLALTSNQNKLIIDWAVAKGLVVPISVWHVSHYDDEWEDTLAMEFTSQEQAQAEFDDYEQGDATLTQKQGFAPTTLLQERMGIKISSDMAVDMAIVCYSHDVLHHDGVWWDEDYDPSRLSCPRGVIHSDTVDTYQFRAI